MSSAAEDANLPKVGSVRKIILSNGMVRTGKIVGYDLQMEMALVRWIEYPQLPIDYLDVEDL